MVRLPWYYSALHTEERKANNNVRQQRGEMPLYFSAHTTACLTKQALKELMKGLLNGKQVKVRRCVSSQIGGRMLTEVEAPDQQTLEKFFQAHYVNCEWIMRIDLDAKEGGVTEY
jgi:hypothetical protein